MTIIKNNSILSTFLCFLPLEFFSHECIKNVCPTECIEKIDLPFLKKNFNSIVINNDYITAHVNKIIANCLEDEKYSQEEKLQLLYTIPLDFKLSKTVTKYLENYIKNLIDTSYNTAYKDSLKQKKTKDKKKYEKKIKNDIRENIKWIYFTLNTIYNKHIINTILKNTLQKSIDDLMQDFFSAEHVEICHNDIYPLMFYSFNIISELYNNHKQLKKTFDIDVFFTDTVKKYYKEYYEKNILDFLRKNTNHLKYYNKLSPLKKINNNCAHAEELCTAVCYDKQFIEDEMTQNINDIISDIKNRVNQGFYDNVDWKDVLDISKLEETNWIMNLYAPIMRLFLNRTHLIKNQNNYLNDIVLNECLKRFQDIKQDINSIQLTNNNNDTNNIFVSLHEKIANLTQSCTDFIQFYNTYSMNNKSDYLRILKESFLKEIKKFNKFLHFKKNNLIFSNSSNSELQKILFFYMQNIYNIDYKDEIIKSIKIFQEITNPMFDVTQTTKRSHSCANTFLDQMNNDKYIKLMQKYNYLQAAYKNKKLSDESFLIENFLILINDVDYYRNRIEKTELTEEIINSTTNDKELNDLYEMYHYKKTDKESKLSDQLLHIMNYEKIDISLYKNIINEFILHKKIPVFEINNTENIYNNIFFNALSKANIFNFTYFQTKNKKNYNHEDMFIFNTEQYIAKNILKAQSKNDSIYKRMRILYNIINAKNNNKNNPEKYILENIFHFNKKNNFFTLATNDDIAMIIYYCNTFYTDNELLNNLKNMLRISQENNYVKQFFASIQNFTYQSQNKNDILNKYYVPIKNCFSENPTEGFNELIELFDKRIFDNNLKSNFINNIIELVNKKNILNKKKFQGYGNIISSENNYDLSFSKVLLLYIYKKAKTPYIFLETLFLNSSIDKNINAIDIKDLCNNLKYTNDKDDHIKSDILQINYNISYYNLDINNIFNHVFDNISDNFFNVFIKNKPDKDKLQLIINIINKGCTKIINSNEKYNYTLIKFNPNNDKIYNLLKKNHHFILFCISSMFNNFNTTNNLIKLLTDDTKDPLMNHAIDLHSLFSIPPINQNNVDPFVTNLSNFLNKPNINKIDALEKLSLIFKYLDKSYLKKNKLTHPALLLLLKHQTIVNNLFKIINYGPNTYHFYYISSKCSNAEEVKDITTLLKGYYNISAIKNEHNPLIDNLIPKIKNKQSSKQIYIDKIIKIHLLNILENYDNEKIVEKFDKLYLYLKNNRKIPFIKNIEKFNQVIKKPQSSYELFAKFIQILKIIHNNPMCFQKKNENYRKNALSINEIINLYHKEDVIKSINIITKKSNALSIQIKNLYDIVNFKNKIYNTLLDKFLNKYKYTTGNISAEEQLLIEEKVKNLCKQVLHNNSNNNETINKINDLTIQKEVIKTTNEFTNNIIHNFLNYINNSKNKEFKDKDTVKHILLSIDHLNPIEKKIMNNIVLLLDYKDNISYKKKIDATDECCNKAITLDLIKAHLMYYDQENIIYDFIMQYISNKIINSFTRQKLAQKLNYFENIKKDFNNNILKSDTLENAYWKSKFKCNELKSAPNINKNALYRKKILRRMYDSALKLSIPLEIIKKYLKLIKKHPETIIYRVIENKNDIKEMYRNLTQKIMIYWIFDSVIQQKKQLNKANILNKYKEMHEDYLKNKNNNDSLESIEKFYFLNVFNNLTIKLKDDISPYNANKLFFGENIIPYKTIIFPSSFYQILFNLFYISETGKIYNSIENLLPKDHNFVLNDLPHNQQFYNNNFYDFLQSFREQLINIIKIDNGLLSIINEIYDEQQKQATIKKQNIISLNTSECDVRYNENDSVMTISSSKIKEVGKIFQTLYERGAYNKSVSANYIKLLRKREKKEDIFTFSLEISKKNIHDPISFVFKKINDLPLKYTISIELLEKNIVKK